MRNGKYRRSIVQLLTLITIGVTVITSAAVLQNCSDDDEISSKGVYVAGFERIGNFNVATYWKDGKAVRLADAPVDTQANSITFADGDMYIAGSAGSASLGGVYWKNNEEAVILNTDSWARASSIAVSGSDVYVAGSKEGDEGQEVATCWKNGEAITLTEDSNDSFAKSIATSGANVYIAGYKEDAASLVSPVYWTMGSDENPVTMPLGLSDGATSGIANSVATSGTDVYIAGFQAIGSVDVATIWRKGDYEDYPVTPTDNTVHSKIFSIAVSEGHYYAVGYKVSNGVNIAICWIHGSEVPLSDGSKHAFATSVFISNGVAYIAGYEDAVTGTTAAKYWKIDANDNVTEISLTEGETNAQALSIFVLE